MTAQPFVHLHCHTMYSLLDGANHIPSLIQKVKDSGMNAVAITDHGNLYGALEFYTACRAADINPIIGYEAYVAPRDRRDRTSSRMKDAAYHLTLLAADRQGFKNLIRLASIAYIEGYYYKPRIDKQVLEEYSDGLICLSGCPSSELSVLLYRDRQKEAEELVAWFVRVFGNRFYLEIQDAGFDFQKECKEKTLDLARRMGLPVVATNDAHYLNREDAYAHDVLLCINTHAVRSDKKRMRMETNELYVKTPEEMYEKFADCPDAVARTQEIADQVDIDLDLNKRHFPVFTPPEGKTDTQYLRELCEERLPLRYGNNITDEIRKRLDYELSIIDRMGYSSYFLIVWDFVRFAEEHDIPCRARGSACGSLVAYLLGLSCVCPIKYGLLFERFLDPNRAEPPDIDIDFCRDNRQAVIEYTKQKYGKDNVSQIGTFGTLKARAAIRDVGRALGIPLARVDKIAKLVPAGPNVTLSQALEESPELKELYDTDNEARELISIAMRLEGLARSAGTHAAGVVIADRPLWEYVPLQTIGGKDDLVTQWDGPHVEKAGLLKMDFLGLRNLTILHKAIKNVKKHHGIDIDPVKIPLDDEKTFALLQRGETKGIFQLEGDGMRKLLQDMKPDHFRDIIATSALYRPGPLEGGMVRTYVDVKHGRSPVPKVHPIVDEILAETYGVMVYQEQVMQILNRVGGIELSASYRCIKAISKKKHAIIAKFREEFIEGAQKNGLPKEKAVELFEMIEKFAGYGFNKSHSTAYGALAYQTAYLKAHFPKEFMAALLSCGMESSTRISEHVEDCRRMGIEVVPPDINRSDVEFTVDGERILFGLGAIKGVGEGDLKAIIEEREKNGPFKSIFDLAQRVDPKHLTKTVLETLIKAGALDSLGPNRHQHMMVVQRALQFGAARKRDRDAGQKSLFGGDDDDTGEDMTADFSLPQVEDWPRREKLTYEKEVLGFYLSSHPFVEYADRIRRHTKLTTKSLAELEEGTEVLVGGMASAIRRRTVKRARRDGLNRYVQFELEDLEGSIPCTMWPEQYEQLGSKLEEEGVYLVKGRLEKRGSSISLIVSDLLTMEEADQKLMRQVVISFQAGIHGDEDFRRVRNLLEEHPGKTPVTLIVLAKDTLGDAPSSESDSQWYRFYLSQKTGVCCTQELMEQLTEVLGREHVQFIGAARNNSAPAARTKKIA